MDIDNLKWTLRHSVRPGDIGYLTYLHGVICAREYRYDPTFEAYVAAGIADFIESFNPEKDRIWLAETNRQIIGAIAVVGRSKRKAQLRWFFVHPAHRGRGLEKNCFMKHFDSANDETIMEFSFGLLANSLQPDISTNLPVSGKQASRDTRSGAK